MTRIDARPDTEEDESADLFDRPRGILTPDDRKYLFGQKEGLSAQAERDTRYRIRNRVKNAIWDFHLLFRLQEKRDREKVFSELREDPRFLRELLAYIYMGELDYHSTVESSLEGFSELVEQAVGAALTESGHLIADLDVVIKAEATQPDKEMILTKINNKEDDPDELAYLLKHGDLTQKEHRVVIRRMMEHVMNENLTIQFEHAVEGELKKLTPDDAQAVLDRYDDYDDTNTES